MLSCFAGELGALEEVVGQLVTRGLLKPNTLKALWLICSNAFDQLTHVSTQHKQYLDWRSLHKQNFVALRWPQGH